MKKKLWTLLPLILILIGIITLYISGAYHQLNFHNIQEKHTELLMYTQEHPLLAALYFIGIYISSVSLIIPDSTLLSILAGFLFPLPLAVAYIIISETIGAFLFFLAVNHAVSLVDLKKKFSKLVVLEKKIHASPAIFLLFFRFSHLLPFWIINFAAGCLDIKKWTFLWTTWVGVLPLAIILAEGGMGLSHYFQTHATFSIDAFFNTQMKLTLIGMGLITLLPIWLKPKIIK